MMPFLFRLSFSSRCLFDVFVPWKVPSFGFQAFWIGRSKSTKMKIVMKIPHSSIGTCTNGGCSISMLVCQMVTWFMRTGQQLYFNFTLQLT